MPLDVTPAAARRAFSATAHPSASYIFPTDPRGRINLWLKFEGLWHFKPESRARREDFSAKQVEPQRDNSDPESRTVALLNVATRGNPVNNKGIL